MVAPTAAQPSSGIADAVRACQHMRCSEEDWRMGSAERFDADQAIDWGVSVKRVVILAAFLLTIATLLTHEAYVLRPADPMWLHLAPFRWWLLPHIAGGMLAFLLTPL